MANTTKIFDPGDPATASFGMELTDASIIRRDGTWTMFLAGQQAPGMPTDIYYAALPPDSSLLATGWKLAGVEGSPTPVAGRAASSGWDGAGGRHCPSYVRGWDPVARREVERIYYAGSAEHSWGPYRIGYLEWNGNIWIDQPQPVFSADMAWEQGSVYEPNLIYHDGKWKMWYVAGSAQNGHVVQGYAESLDGRTGWSRRAPFAPAEMNMFDFCVRQQGGRLEAVFSRGWYGAGDAPQETGLWWCSAPEPSHRLADWGKPVQIMTAEDRGWHSAPWKPTFHRLHEDQARALIFFDGHYRKDGAGAFPFVFTLGCLELDLPIG